MKEQLEKAFGRVTEYSLKTVLRHAEKYGLNELAKTDPYESGECWSIDDEGIYSNPRSGAVIVTRDLAKDYLDDNAPTPETAETFFGCGIAADGQTAFGAVYVADATWEELVNAAKQATEAAE